MTPVAPAQAGAHDHNLCEQFATVFMGPRIRVWSRGRRSDTINGKLVAMSSYDLQLLLKLLHVLGAAVLFGTGAGIAFFMWMAHRTGRAVAVAEAARVVVIADTVFTASAVIAQPLTGVALAYVIGYSLTESWIVLSIALYLLVGACWLPVVWIQIRLRDLAAKAAASGAPLPPRSFSLFRIWFILGWPAFAGVIAIFALMIWKPSLW
jgi:uncharacterized membrane protein